MVLVTSVTVSLPQALRARAGNQAKVVAAGRTVGEIIEALEREFPGIKFNLCQETGSLRPYVNIFVNGQNIRYLQGLETGMEQGAQVHILQSVAGG